MDELSDESVHLIITSPPYWQLKDYANSEQIGFNDTYEEYINNLNLVWSECFRVLRPGCRLCINIGDQFARSVYYGRYKVIPIRTEIIKFCETIGFDYMGAIIWQKVTTTNTTGGASVMGSFPYPRNGILKLDYEFILIFKKQGNPPKVSSERKEKSKLTTREWNEYFSGHWNFRGQRQSKHLAMFPGELPYRLIKMFSFVEDLVLDPFLGSGTTTVTADKLGRNSAGYEINREFLPIIKEKLELDQKGFLTDSEYTIIIKNQTIDNISEKINKLPYVFNDPIKVVRKVDPKKLQFGSKIDDTSKKEKNIYYRVKNIQSPEIIVLNNDLTVRLLGIRTTKEFEEKAIDFLYNRTKGQNVFMKFDQIKFDENNNLLCYLYLKNKTFLNAHLVKQGLVDVDETIDFKHKQNFLKFRKENHV